MAPASVFVLSPHPKSTALFGLDPLYTVHITEPGSLTDGLTNGLTYAQSSQTCLHGRCLYGQLVAMTNKSITFENVIFHIWTNGTPHNNPDPCCMTACH